MAAIGKFLETIGQAFMAVIDFVVKMVQDLIFIVEMLAELAPQIPAWYTWFPPVLWYTFGLCISVAIVFKIVGRDG